ncbi:MAG: hypothetical protein M3Q27_01600 [Actinomycetota bacterium]|nr:hypothetical protein [Actinomycetota bacterium]
MRIYVPATLATLRTVLASGEVAPVPLTAFAVTPHLREAYATGDQEELEYAAMTEAARASLRLLEVDPSAPRRRVVLAADVPESAVTARPEVDPAAVRVEEPVPLRRLASAHIDDAEAQSDVAAAVAALAAADDGDDDAQFTVDGAEGHELLWYASQELAAVVETA